MTAKQIAYRKNLITQIQILKKGVFEDEEDRREFLRSRFGVESLKAMRIEELSELLGAMKRGKLNEIKPRKIEPIIKGKATPSQCKAMRGLWREYATKDKSDAALMRWLKRFLGGDLWIRPEALDVNTAKKAIAALRKINAIKTKKANYE
jgi:hypothetical protein